MRGDNDYVYVDKTVKLRKSGSVSASVVGDRRAEPTETFRVEGYSISGGSFDWDTGRVIIVDNDTP